MRWFKKGQMFETLAPWLLGLAVLVLVVAFLMILKGKGGGALEFLKNVFKFR